jgi:hypothetical protein
MLAASVLSYSVNGQQAETLASVAAKAHLLGSWAADCSKPPAQNNTYATYEDTTDGGVRARYDTGIAKGSFEAVLDRVAILSPTTVFVRRRRDAPVDRQPSSWSTDLVFEVSDDRKFTLQAIRMDGRIIVKDGQLPDGKPFPVQHRCTVRPNA